MDEFIESSPIAYKSFQECRKQRVPKHNKIRKRKKLQEESVESENVDDSASLGCSVIKNERDESNEVQSTSAAKKSSFKTPPRKVDLAKSDKPPSSPLFPPNLFGLDDDEDLFKSDDEGNHDSQEVQFSQKLAKLDHDVKPLPHIPSDVDFYEAGRFIQATVLIPKRCRISDTQKFKNIEMSQLPAHLIDILDGKYPVREEKSEVEVVPEVQECPDQDPLELFADQMYGGLGERFDKPRNPSPKFSSWTLHAREMREKKGFEPPKEFQNLKGEEFPTIEEDLLSQMPPVHLKHYFDRNKFNIERLPSKIQSIVTDFEAEEEDEKSPNCSPIHLTLIPPRKTYEKVRTRLIFDAIEPEKLQIIDLDELNHVDVVQHECSLVPSELDLSRDSKIFVELDVLTQSFKQSSRAEEPSLETNLTSPERSLIRPMEFQNNCSLDSSPKSEGSFHLSNFGSQEMLNDEDFALKKTVTVGTSPIKEFCDPLPVIKDLSEKPIRVQMPLKVEEPQSEENFWPPEPPLPPVPSHSKETFAGFGLASGKKVVTKTNKAMNLFSDIFDEFALEPVAPPMDFGGFKTAGIGSNFGFTSISKPNPVPMELQNTSFDEELSVDMLNQLSHVEKKALQKTKTSSPLKAVENFVDKQLRPKRVNELRSPKNLTASSPVIDSPESFMSSLINRDSTAASTPLNRKTPVQEARERNFKRTKLVNRMSESVAMENGSVYEEMTQEMNEIRMKSYWEQDKMIQQKTEEMKKPTPGTLIRKKAEKNRLKWNEFMKKELVMKEIKYKSVTSSFEVISSGTEVTFSNAKNFRFNILQFCSKSELESNKMRFPVSPTLHLIPDDKYRTGFGEFLNLFKTLPGVDPSLFNLKWFQHHYKMIVFKLYRHAKRAKVPSSIFLTPQNMIDQLKYRYDREIDKVSRSAIKKCVEGDDVPYKRLVLEMVDMQNNVIVLSDGWYTIKAEVDEELRRKVTQKTIKIGSKLVTTGAEITNLKSACSPLEMPDNIRLKIHYNSSRPAASEAKLGYQRNPFPLLIQLNDIKIQGGIVSSVLVFVARVYPPVFHDKSTKQYYSEHQERRAASKLEVERQAQSMKILEETTEEVKREFRTEHQGFNSSPDTIKLHHARKALEEGVDITDFTKTQQELLGMENARINEEIVRRCMDRSKFLVRQVSPCLRIGVLDARRPEKTIIVTLWKAKDIYNPFLKENSVIKISHLNPMLNNGELRLCSTNSTTVKPVKQQFSIPSHFKRKVTDLQDIPELSHNPPPFGEVDVLGLVISIQTKSEGQFVFLSNAKGNAVSIKFAPSIDDTTPADVIKEGTFIHLKNLEWHSVGSTNTSIPTLFINPLYTKCTSLIGKQLTKEQKEFLDTFHGINLVKFAQDLSEKLGIELNVQKINESLGDSTRQEIGDTSANHSLGTKRRLGNTSNTGMKKKRTS